MSDSIEALILDLLEWLGRERRDYEEVLSAWRTSCPRLPVWEEANRRGLVARDHDGGRAFACVTAEGSEFLRKHRPSCERG